MKKTAQKAKSSTQNFIEIQDIVENVVMLSGGNACLIIEVEAINFPLLSKEEQDAKLLAYSSLLNSLSFPIQIVIRSKKIDISSYLKLLNDEVAKNQNPLLKEKIKQYRDYVAELVRVNVVLDKKFYIVASYSYLEGNVLAGKQSFFTSARASLLSKAESLHAQLKRLGLPAKTLEKENLVKLFYELFNGDLSIVSSVSEVSRSPIVRQGIV